MTGSAAFEGEQDRSGRTAIDRSSSVHPLAVMAERWVLAGPLVGARNLAWDRAAQGRRRFRLAPGIDRGAVLERYCIDLPRGSAPTKRLTVSMTGC